MSLNWNITKCKNNHLIASEERWPTTEALIFITMAIGIGDWSEKNIGKVIERIRIWENMETPMLRRNGEPFNMPEEYINDMIGLKVNVSMESDAKWRNRMWAGIVLDAKRDLRNARKEPVAVSTD